MYVLTQVLPQTALEGESHNFLRGSLIQYSVNSSAWIKAEAQWIDVVITRQRKTPLRWWQSIQEIADERGSDPGSVVLDIILEQQGM